ncbi:MAG: 2Fe-2S iron-sulfur cluster-binding protein [Pseudomonadota bacterium]
MLKCTINGQELEVKEGTSVIEAFKMVEQDIAHYCWHPGLSVAGVCRLCMVEIEGNPRLQIACNTMVQDGMVVTNQSEMVKDAVKWGLDFHLINHPLDCPICDQAGECGLQDQYMQFGQYDSQMGQQKVKKKKVVDLGEKIVLDSERCILCSRCVRFTEEVSKTNELGIFNRGDHSEIGTYAGKPLNNDYAVNTVDICPVGALTSKEFRFRQRVWFLKDKPSVCTGCSTGCSVDVYFNKEGMWRVKPRHSEVNGYWMCDEGREIFKATNIMTTEFVGERGNQKAIKKENRLIQALHKNEGTVNYKSSQDSIQSLTEKLSSYKKAALVLTGQYTNEEYLSLVRVWKEKFGVDNVYHWLNHPGKLEDFDGLLIRGDKNANTKGLLKVLSDEGITAKTDFSGIDQSDLIVVAGPENQWTFDDINQKAQIFAKAGKVVWISACHVEEAEQAGGHMHFIPAKTAVEKSGTFTNHAGIEQKVEKVDLFVEQALSLVDVATIMSGGEVHTEFSEPVEIVSNEFVHERGQL